MSAVRIIGADELRAAVRFEDLIEPVSRAFREASAGLAENGLIVTFPGERPDLGDVYVKTGVLRGHRVYIVKVSPWFALNVERGQPQGGFIGVFDSGTGHTLAILNEEHYLSDIRTAAAGSLAARVLAPAHVGTAAVLGAGVQAYWQPQALYRERPFETLLIWARTPEKASALAARLAPVLPGVDILVSDNLERTVREADVLITATQAREPLVRGEWLREGQHITAVGADDATKCELDAATLKRARVFVDDRQTAAANGDVYHAVQAGGYTPGDVAGEIGEVLAGRKAGRISAGDITVAKFVGIGVQDLAAAEVALEKLGVLQAPALP
ncbi:cyclodeaminase (plasmid) [Deinococcus aetherius]|uniref:Cyclodeaminase n=1 Tax=Deinococcus aetherius TaxID=200252 RepID=A0ABN6RLA9_9DEIO|nr:ornithine cyclodeaminase family protein [Deinococcus aetherius]BDP43654.1 cyclodeaminase [Deinococcus aetherius]